MSLSTVMTALAEYVGDQLVNTYGRPVPDRVLRYHGTLPQDCCTDNGYLAVSWEQDYPSIEFPNQTSTAKSPCQGSPVAIIALRYVTCWAVPEVTPEGVQLIDATWDAKAAVLADVADGIGRSILRLGCDGLDLSDPFVRAVLEACGRGGVRHIEARPIVAQGGCAGVLWRIYARVRSAEIPS